MKKTIFGFLSLLVVLLTTGCLKNNDTSCTDTDRAIVAPATETAAITAYLTAAGLTGYTQHSSGLFYKIETPSTTNYPNLCSRVVVAYTGKLTNGNSFDQSTGATFTLGSTVEGWRKGIPLVGKGGKIKLVIPPSLGYGIQEVRNNNAVVIIPSNSILVFEVSVNDVL
jgi:FKBP-type peptidyl-prolyl cis-trans isomerase FkpA